MTERSNGASSGTASTKPRPHYPPLAQQPPADPNPPYRLPLAGVRILDMSVFQQGTYASAMLADSGRRRRQDRRPGLARPRTRQRGSASRRTASARTSSTSTATSARSASILKHERGRETFLKVVETADIFHNNMRPGVLDRLGLTYEVLKERNPRIIVSNATGWGNEGPDAEAQMGSMDILAQARGGIMSVTGTPDTGPLPVGAPFADHTGAIISAFGMMTALWEREHSGEGQVIDTSLYGSQLCIQGLNIHLGDVGRPAPRPGRRRGPTAALGRSTSARTASTSSLAAASPPSGGRRFCEVMGAPELAEGGAPAHMKSDENRVRRARLQEIFLTKPRADWLSILQPQFFVQAISDYLEIAEDEQPWANGYLTNMPDPRDPEAPSLPTVGPPVRLSRTPASVRAAAPEFGQHTEEVLLEAGFEWDQIAELREAGAFGDLANVSG